MAGKVEAQVRFEPEVEDEIKKVMKDVLYYLEGWCACSEASLFNRAIAVLRELGLLEEFKEKYGLPRNLYGIKSALYDFVDFVREKYPELVEEVENEVYAEDEDEEDGGVEGEENKEEGNDIDIETIETLKKGISEFSKRLIEKASQFSNFRTDMIRTAIALSQGKYRIMNPQELKGIKKDDIDTILFTYNCFNGLRTILKLKNGRDRIISIKVIEDEEVQKLVGLMKIQYEALQREYEKDIEFREEIIDKKEREIEELKAFTMRRLIENDDIEGLKNLVFFHGDLETTKMALEYAIEMNKDVMKIAEALSDIEGTDTIAYLLYQIDKEKAFEFMNEYNIDFELLKQDFELEA